MSQSPASAPSTPANTGLSAVAAGLKPSDMLDKSNAAAGTLDSEFLGSLNDKLSAAAIAANSSSSGAAVP